jgi:hypothetical protein
VCRTPGFWGTHAEANPRKPGSHDITGAFLPVTVCGVTLNNTDVGNHCSAEEALCVSPTGVQRLQLARQLTAAELNCKVETCPNATLDLLATCNQVCTDDVDQTAIGQCIESVDAFNNGVSSDAPGCENLAVPGFDPPGPAGSSGNCNTAIGNAVTIFSGGVCP